MGSGMTIDLFGIRLARYLSSGRAGNRSRGWRRRDGDRGGLSCAECRARWLGLCREMGIDMTTDGIIPHLYELYNPISCNV